jgi:NitT/TauT family transport system substrate-binding protein
MLPARIYATLELRIASRGLPPTVIESRLVSPTDGRHSAGLDVRRLAVGLVVAVILGACSSPGAAGTADVSGATASAVGAATAPALQGTLKLGYFPNITHATALVGVESGIFANALGPGVVFETASFNAGSSAVEALLNGAIDVSYIGPNPAINAFAKSSGQAIRIIAGATSGGAFLIVKPDIETVADLAGKKLATPQLGNTQDVALRTWLLDNGLETDPQGGGDVSILPQENAQTLETFLAGEIDGAWVPEPWATRLLLEGNGKVLVDERSLWPEGAYVTTHLIVRTDYLEAHPDLVKALLLGHIEANDLVSSNPARAQELTNQGIERITSRELREAVLEAAWKNLEFTLDPIATSLAGSADHASRVGLLEPVDLTGIYDLGLLNALLRTAGRPEVGGL